MFVLKSLNTWKSVDEIWFETLHVLKLGLTFRCLAVDTIKILPF
jgi:hypothetical protein